MTRFPRAALVAAALLSTLAAAGCVPSSEAPSGAPAAGFLHAIRASEVDLWRGVNDRGLTLDVREEGEWNDALGHLDGAVNIPLGQLEERIGELAAWRERPVLVYDKDGTRAQAAAGTLSRHGFRDLSWLDGGLVAYRAHMTGGK